MSAAASACPTCGSPSQLPRITPEMLFFRAGQSGAALPSVAAVMPDESRAVAFDGVIYQMPAADWHHYESMRANWRALPLDAAAA
jgi:hypothetical protein